MFNKFSGLAKKNKEFLFLGVAISFGVIYCYLTKDNNIENEEFEEEEKNKNEPKLKEKRNEKKKYIPNFEISLEGEFLSLECLKKIIMESIILCLPNLVFQRNKQVKIRRKNFNDFSSYVKSNDEFYNNFEEILRLSLDLICEGLKINNDLYVKSRVFHEENKSLRPSYLRDMCWHLISDVCRPNSDLNKEEFKNYLELQINYLKIEIKDSKYGPFNKFDKMKIISAIVDDKIFFNLGIDDLDYIKNFKKFMKDKEITDLVEKRNTLLMGNY